MRFTKELLKSLVDSGQEVCIFSKEVSSLLSNFSRNDFNNFSTRSYYLWKNQERPIPLSAVIKIIEKLNLKNLEVEYFSTKGGNKIRFPNKENVSFCYFLGVVLGDGCIIHSIRGNRNSWSIQITSNSIEKIKYFRKLILELFEAKTVFYHVKNYYNLHIFSKPLAMILANKYEIPIGLKYEKIKVPEIVKKRQGWKKGFIKGVFKCDGNIYNYRSKKSVQLRQKSKGFLIGVREICNDIGIFFHEPYYDKANNSWVLWTCKRSVVGNFIKKISDFKIEAPVTQPG